MTVFAYKPSQAPGDRPLTAKAPVVGAGLAAPTIAVVGCWPGSLKWASGRRASTLAGVVTAGGAETLRRTAMPDGRATGGCGRSGGDWKIKALRPLRVRVVPRPLLVLKPSRSLGVFFGWLGSGPVAGPRPPAPSEPTERWRPVADGRPAGAAVNDLARAEPVAAAAAAARLTEAIAGGAAGALVQPSEGGRRLTRSPGWFKAPPGERLGAGARRAQLTTGIEAKPTGPTAALAPGRYPGRRPLLPMGWRLGLPGAPSDTPPICTGPGDTALADTGPDTAPVDVAPVVIRPADTVPGDTVPGDMWRDNTVPGDDSPRARVRRIGSVARLAPTAADRPTWVVTGRPGAAPAQLRIVMRPLMGVFAPARRAVAVVPAFIVMALCAPMRASLGPRPGAAERPRPPAERGEGADGAGHRETTGYRARPGMVRDGIGCWTAYRCSPARCGVSNVGCALREAPAPPLEPAKRLLVILTAELTGKLTSAGRAEAGDLNSAAGAGVPSP